MLVEVNLRSRQIVFASDRLAAIEIREAHVSGRIELMNTADSDASDGLAAFNKLPLPDRGTASDVGQAAGTAADGACASVGDTADGDGPGVHPMDVG